ncbi:hypothetical protein Dimus_030575, partial [Dionaea muscipula]
NGNTGRPVVGFWIDQLSESLSVCFYKGRTGRAVGEVSVVWVLEDLSALSAEQ